MNSENSKQPRHCPFCGKPPVVRRVVEEYAADAQFPAGEVEVRVTIDCDECGISVGEEYRSEAIGAWNRRKRAEGKAS